MSADQAYDVLCTGNRGAGEGRFRASLTGAVRKAKCIRGRGGCLTRLNAGACVLH